VLYLRRAVTSARDDSLSEDYSEDSSRSYDDTCTFDALFACVVADTVVL